MIKIYGRIGVIERKQGIVGQKCVNYSLDLIAYCSRTHTITISYFENVIYLHVNKFKAILEMFEMFEMGGQ